MVSGSIDIGICSASGIYKDRRDCIVENISYDSDMNATITAFMYSDDVYTLDTIPCLSAISTVRWQTQSRYFYLW